MSHRPQATLQYRRRARRLPIKTLNGYRTFCKTCSVVSIKYQKVYYCVALKKREKTEKCVFVPGILKQNKTITTKYDFTPVYGT